MLSPAWKKLSIDPGATMTANSFLATSITTPERQKSTEVPHSLSHIVAALSYALDITEGQPKGHAARTCMIGMRIAEAMQLSSTDRSALFYALLLKDAGCSSNAAKMAYLFGNDDRQLKMDVKTIDWQRAWEKLRYVRQHVLPGGTYFQRLLRTVALMLQGSRGAKQLIQTRCERGAEIALKLGFPEATATAIRDLDEHWNGHGHPLGLRGEEISLLGRIACLAQTVEVFVTQFGSAAATEMAAARSGTWFDPQLVSLLLNISHTSDLWRELGELDLGQLVARWQPMDTSCIANDQQLDTVAEAFAQIIDAKSPWTFRHSEGVAEIAVGMARIVGLNEQQLRRFRRTALLHDIGKLGVSNLILDKPGKLTDAEFAIMKRHPADTEEILSRVPAFNDQAVTAGAHHERLDGKGYHRGIPSLKLPLEARILMVADVFEALTAARPYRDAVPVGKVLEILRKDAGVGICPQSLEMLEYWLERTDFIGRFDAQIEQIDRLKQDLAAPCNP